MSSSTVGSRRVNGAAVGGARGLRPAAPPHGEADALVAFPTLVDVLRWRACERPQRCTYTFLEDGEASESIVTNGELDARARAIATMLQERGLRGERAVLLYPPGLDLIAALFGCLYAGTVAVLAYPPDPGRLGRTLPRLLSVLADARPSAWLTTSAMGMLGDAAFAGVEPLDALLRLTTDDVDIARAAEWRDPDVRPDGLALLQYTSGSTDEPRGVMLTHANLLDNLQRIQRCFGNNADSHSVIWLPPYHDMGLIGGIFEPLYSGSTVTLMSPLAFLQRPVRWLQAVSRTRAAFSGGPNFAYDLCVRKTTERDIDTLDLRSWEVAFNGAESVRSETLARFTDAFRRCGFRRRAFLPCYGLAEATLIVTGSRSSGRVDGAAADGAPQSTVSCGAPIVGQQVVIVDPERRTVCAPDVAGEIWIAGPSVAAGYWNRPDESARTFGATLANGDGPFLRTGDLGVFRDGELYVTCRLKDLIIIRGRNVHPQDVERTAETSHPALRPGSGAAFGVDVEGAERLVVVQEVDVARAPALAEVIGAVRRAVAVAHEVQPHAVLLIEPRSIPKTSSGKIQRGETRERFLDGTLPVVLAWRDDGTRAEDEPSERRRDALPRMSRKGIEDWLVTEIARRLGLDPAEIDPGEPFAAYGLDSALGVAMVGDLEAALDITLPATLAWDYPTITALADHLSRAVAGGTPDARLGTEA